MNLLSVNALSKSYGSKVLFSDINFGLSQGDKVAIVARNGSGKTTLFKILKGIEIPDSGQVTFRKNIRVAFLDQNFSLDESLSISETLQRADNPFVKCITEYDEAVNATERSPGEHSAARLDAALQKMNTLNAWEYEKNMKEILSRLEIHDLEQPVSTLSGGQKKRVALALALINRPDLLIMDEPTNHLDIEMIEWLEHYLSDSSLTLLLVTHDRYFLDAVCDRIIEIDRGELFEYKGDFEYFLGKKAEREAIRDAEIDKAKNLYRRELEWIRKMPKARGTKARYRVNAFAETEQKARQRRSEKEIELSVKMQRLGSKIVELHNISKSYGDKLVLRPFSYTFISGEKIGIAGRNGAGKSTFLKIIMGEVESDSGKVQKGDTVVFGHYSQEGMVLNEDKRIIEVVKDIAEFIPLANGASLSASQLLTRFNFPPEVQYSYVSKLSGGEKRRLYLLTVLVKNPNFLVLDEPTNDLDIQTLQTLEEFLDDFKGCVLIVSHDRYFIDRLADHVFVFEGEGDIKDYPGSYSDYRQWKELENRLAGERSDDQVKQADPKSQDTPPAAAGKKLSYKLQRELAQLEEEIPRLEQKKLELEAKLSAAGTDYSKISEISAALQALNNDLDAKSFRWLEIQEL